MIVVIDGCELKRGQKVQMYRNLHKDTFSIRDAKTKRVIAYGNHVKLSNVRMNVQKSGREKVRREKRKHIHAFITGIYEGNDQIDINKSWELIYYNPYTTETFIKIATGEPTFNANRAYLSNGKCFVQIDP